MQKTAQTPSIQTRNSFDCSNVFNKIYGCNSCEYKTQFLIKYTEHKSCIKNGKRDSVKKFPDDFVTSMVCMVCNFRTFSKLVFLKHLHKCPHVRCPDYVYNTKCSSCKVRHGFPKHTPIYNCEQCCFWSLESYEVGSHNRHMHCLPNYRWLRCDLCPFQTLWESSLRLHRASDLCQAANTPPDSWFECEQCTYKTKRKFCLEVHVFRKHRKFKCELCDYHAPVEYYLELHLRIKHSIRKIKTHVWHPCDKCPYKSRKKSNLDKHVWKTHESVKGVRRKRTELYLCDRCAYSSKSLNHFRRHVYEQHTPADEYDWFRCEHCSYKAKQRYHLKLHVIQKHTALEDIEWYECDKCPYKGKLKASLKNHMARKHASQKV